MPLKVCVAVVVVVLYNFPLFFQVQVQSVQSCSLREKTASIHFPLVQSTCRKSENSYTQLGLHKHVVSGTISKKEIC